MKRIVLSIIIGLIILIAAWYGFHWYFEKRILDTPLPTKPTLAVGTSLFPPKPTGHFSLVNTEGQPFTEASLFGQWTLLFFGYSNCPNICPATLGIMSDLWRTHLETSNPENVPHFVFVSLDPKIDSIQTLQSFLKGFHPGFIGLTGESKEIERLAKACNIYSFEDSSQNGKKVIDHSATLLLINPQGRIQALFSPPHNATAIAKDLKILLSTKLSTG